MEEQPAEEQWKSIKEWETEERPREKMIQRGVNALTNSELIAILLQNGTHKKSAVDLAKELLAKAHNDLNELARIGMKAMMEVKGIGTAKAVTLIAALELGRRKQLDSALERKSLSSSKAAADMLHPLLADLPHEAFIVVYLNMAHKVIHYEQISTGGLSGTVVDVRIIMKNALQHRASHIIIAHNHPSGNLKASKADEQVTQKLKQAASLFDIRLSDHIIITNKGYLSFADEGLL